MAKVAAKFSDFLQMKEEVTATEIEAETEKVAVTGDLFETTADAEDSTVTFLASSQYWNQSASGFDLTSVCWNCRSQ